LICIAVSSNNKSIHYDDDDKGASLVFPFERIMLLLLKQVKCKTRSNLHCAKDALQVQYCINFHGTIRAVNTTVAICKTQSACIVSDIHVTESELLVTNSIIEMNLIIKIQFENAFNID